MISFLKINIQFLRNIGYNYIYIRILEGKMLCMHKNIHYTEADFEDVQANYSGKAEYSNGYIVLSSSTSIKHNKIISMLNFKLMSFLDKSKCDVYTESIEVIFRNNEEVYKFKPDVFVMCEEKKMKGESFISPPKIIFEVISKSTAGHDYITKLDVYQRLESLSIIWLRRRDILYSIP